VVLAAREGGPFADLADFCRRTRLSRGLVQNAIRAGACAPFGPRRTLLWELGRLDYPGLEGLLPIGGAADAAEPKVALLVWRRMRRWPGSMS